MRFTVISARVLRFFYTSKDDGWSYKLLSFDLSSLTCNAGWLWPLLSPLTFTSPYDLYWAEGPRTWMTWPGWPLTCTCCNDHDDLSPLLSRMLMTSRWPSEAASMSAERPCLSRCSTLAPCNNTASTRGQHPALAAQRSGGRPRWSVTSRLAPRSSNNSATATWEWRQAAVSAET